MSQVQSSTLHKSPNQNNLRDFICLVLQRKSLGIREVREVALGYAAGKKQNEDSNSGFSGSQILFLSRICYNYERALVVSELTSYVILGRLLI